MQLSHTARCLASPFSLKNQTHHQTLNAVGVVLAPYSPLPRRLYTPHPLASAATEQPGMQADRSARSPNGRRDLLSTGNEPCAYRRT